MATKLDLEQTVYLLSSRFLLRSVGEKLPQERVWVAQAVWMRDTHWRFVPCQWTKHQRLVESIHETSHFESHSPRQTRPGCSVVCAPGDGLGIPHTANLWYREVIWWFNSRNASHFHSPRNRPLTVAKLVRNSEEKVRNHEEYLTWLKPRFYRRKSNPRSAKGRLLGPSLELPPVPIVDAKIRADLRVDGN